MSAFRRLFFITLAVIAAWGELPAASARTEFVMGGDYAYPPYEFIDSHGKPSGFDVDLMRDIAKSFDAAVDVQLGLWNERIAALQSGKIDVISMFYTPERDRIFDFSVPFAIVNHSFFVRKNASTINSFEELKERTVIVEAKSFAHEYLARNRPEIHLVLASSESEALQLLSRSHYDAAIVNQAVGSYLKEKLSLSNIMSSGPPILPIKYCFAVRRENKDLLTHINAGLMSVQSSGKYDELYAKWFVRPMNPFTQRPVQIALIVSAILLAIIFLIIVWNRTLSSQVHLKTRELSQTLGERDRFISIASHELRTPLTPLRLQFQLFEQALERVKNGDASSIDLLLKYSHGMDKQLERFTRLVNNVMDVATIRAGQLLWLKREKCHAGDVVRAVIERFRIEFENAKTPLHVSIEANPECIWDVSRVEQLLTNLLNNALKYARGKPIEITVTEHEGQIEIRIIDHGPGMTPKTREKIFEPFERGTSVSAAGLGLGLFIAKQIVLSHGGTIEADSALGKGTEFTVKIPKKVDEAPRSTEARSA
jgi:polar amino acid transport system substrate-binding protein